MSNKRNSTGNRHQPYANRNQPSIRAPISTNLVPRISTNQANLPNPIIRPFALSPVLFPVSLSLGVDNITPPAVLFKTLSSTRLDSLLLNADFYENMQPPPVLTSLSGSSATQKAIHNLPSSYFGTKVFVDLQTRESFGMVSLVKNGTFGDVYKVIDGCGVVSVLKVPKPTRAASKAVQREIEFLGMLKRSSHVVKFLGAVNTSFEKCFRTELYSLGDFRGLLLNRGTLTTPEVRYFASQILNGLQSIHDKKIIHRDLRPENIFVSSLLTLKIADFGSAVKAGPNVTGRVGMTYYAAPEVVMNWDQDCKVDIFSFGVIACAMLSGMVPVITDMDNIYCWNNEFHEMFSESKCAQHFLARALEVDAKCRATLAELVSHCFIKVGPIPARLRTSVFNSPPTVNDRITWNEEKNTEHCHDKKITNAQRWFEHKR
ncbi:Serine/threonine-protein kinase plk2 [Linnemannia exigua]|uniref:Serine/threonine-protein kinase plk2 n=1 Tax=Linnemannia exigua TaxID=604196 RepID=A0AAD4DDB7_9FUNG|nr:Serine/threonine-protein kinase plk2 [Linnemannia exigua]